MNINSIGNEVYGKEIILLSNENPFKKGALQYHLINFIIKNYSRLSNKTKQDNNNNLLLYIKTQDEAFYIDYWNGFNLFEQALSLAFVHNIIKVKQKLIRPAFGLFAEDGLFDILNEPQFTKYLPKGDMPDNLKLLWLSLYMNNHIKTENYLPKVSLSKCDFNYDGKGYKVELSFDKLSYNKLFESSFNIPFYAFSDCWMSEDWIGLNSRGLFHHIGDHVGFFYGAQAVGDCYFVGKNIFNQLVTLSTPNNHYLNCDSRETVGSPISFKRFSNIHCSDFTYVYGVPKGNPVISADPMLISSEYEDCQLNNNKNIILTEHFWNNSVFMKNANRKMYVGSLDDKFYEIIQAIKPLFENDPLTLKTLNLLSTNKNININIILKMKISDEQNILIRKNSSFFMKSLAHKTVCEIINPISDLELGFFMKHNGNKPTEKQFNILSTLINIAKNKKEIKERTLKSPLNLVKHVFINSFINEKERKFANIWSDDSKKGFLFSELISMKNEYRMFVIHNKVVATSPCFRNTVPLNSWQNGRFDPRLVDGHNAQYSTVNRERVSKYAKFARNFNKQMKSENPNCEHYVLDVAWCEEKQCVVPIELNSITWSGAYQIDMHRVCSGTIKKPYDIFDYKDFFVDKCKFWLQMITDGIINPEIFDLAGLDRTLKGKTQPFIEKTLSNFIQQINNNKTPTQEVFYKEEIITPLQEKTNSIITVLDKYESNSTSIDDEDDYPFIDDDNSKEK